MSLPSLKKSALPPLTPKAPAPKASPTPKVPKAALPPLTPKAPAPKTSPTPKNPKAALPPLTPKAPLPLSASKLPPLTPKAPGTAPKTAPKKKSPPLKKSSVLPRLKSPKPLKREITLTQIKDVDLKILSDLDDRSLLSFCLVDKYANKLCKDENFWRNRFIANYGKEAKPEKRSWRQHYLKAVSDLDFSMSIFRKLKYHYIF